MKENSNPFNPSLAPRNGWELLRWGFFEPILLKQFSARLNKKETILHFLNAYWRLSLIVILLWLFANFLLAAFDIPTFFIDSYGKDFQTTWMSLGNSMNKFKFLLETNWVSLAVGLAFGLAFGLAGGLAYGLAFGLAYGLAFGLAYGLARGLARGLAGGLAVGLAGGLAYDLAFGLAVGLAFGLAVGLAFGLAYGLAGGLAYYISIFRTWTPFIYEPLSWFASLHHNIYLKDGLVYFPVISLENKLKKQALIEPQAAKDFSNFLLEYRPYQVNFAASLSYASHAGLLQKHPLVPEYLEKMLIPEKAKTKYQVRDAWQKQMKITRQSLLNAQKESNIHLKINAFKAFRKELKKWEEIHLIQDLAWRDLYKAAFTNWNIATESQIQELELEAAPLSPNPYVTGDPLYPSRNKTTYRGRKDLQDRILLKIKDSVHFPLFLIQGQRRVGKSSLLNFMEEMLLASRFVFIKMDLQDTNECSSIGVWLERLHFHFNQKLNIQGRNWSAQSENWSASWNELSAYMKKTSLEKEVRIVMAFDEYEQLHNLLVEDEKQAKLLLGNMRSFSQHQKNIVFLFIGTHLFSELKNPDWDNYFIHSTLEPVDYLSHSDTISLITNPYEDFDIQYQEGMPQTIYDWTKGHPALVQFICYFLIEIANKDLRKELTSADLDFIIHEKVLHEGYATLSNFWNQFCKEEETKEVLRAILTKEKPIHKDSIRKLLRHKYIFKNDAGNYEIVVPVIEAWIRKFDLDI